MTDELSQEIMERWSKETPIVLYCHLGERSLQAATVLTERGFLDARSLQGGIDAWSIKVDSKIPRYQQQGGGGGCKG